MRVRSGSMDKLVEVDASPAASGGLSVAGSRGTAAPSSACSLMALPGAPLRGWAQATRGSSGSRSSSSSSEGRGGWQSSAMASAGGSGAQSGRAPPGWGLSIAPNRGRRTAPTPPHQSTGPRPPRPAAGHAPPLEPRDARHTPAQKGRGWGKRGRGGAGRVSPGHLYLRPSPPGEVLCAAAVAPTAEAGPASFPPRSIPSNLNGPPSLLYTLYTFIPLTLSTESS